MEARSGCQIPRETVTGGYKPSHAGTQTKFGITARAVHPLTSISL